MISTSMDVEIINGKINMKIKQGRIRIPFVPTFLIFMAVLLIPSDAGKNVGTIFLKPSPTPEPVQDEFSIRCEIVLEVLQDDTLDAIASNFLVSKEYIAQYNHLKSEEISPGMTLLIPMCKPMPTPTVSHRK
jgi:hypothetical protein